MWTLYRILVTQLARNPHFDTTNAQRCTEAPRSAMYFAALAADRIVRVAPVAHSIPTIFASWHLHLPLLGWGNCTARHRFCRTPNSCRQGSADLHVVLNGGSDRASILTSTWGSSSPKAWNQSDGSCVYPIILIGVCLYIYTYICAYM